ncbi:lactoylglutathione lyase, partial [Phenoliferia sp. Uapishka_3]
MAPPMLSMSHLPTACGMEITLRVTPSSAAHLTDPATFTFTSSLLRPHHPLMPQILGMELLDESPGGDFTNYFLGFPEEGKTLTKEEKASTKTARQGVLELCHNVRFMTDQSLYATDLFSLIQWGTESDPEFKGYSNGNSEPGRGFGHIAYSVDDIQVETDRLTKLGVVFKKRPEEGRMRHIAFILDPDGYWIELVPNRM